jgi:hypothetical protein
MHLRAELLPDDLVVLDETDEFLDEDFVVEDGTDAAQGPEVVFAGPSDAPPPSLSARPHVGRAKEGRGAGRWRMAYVASVGLSGLCVVAISIRLGARHPGPAHVGAPALVAREDGRATAILAPTSTPTPTSTSTPTSTPSLSTEPTTASLPNPEALEAKGAAQRALERGNAKLAIEQGERSVESDSADADAWLILGAAYIQRGNYARARRCFASCVSLATRGAQAECKALLR